MQVLARLRSLFSRRRTATAVLIDMPNVANRDIKHTHKPLRVAWRLLRKEIREDVSGTLIHAAGYHRPARDKDEAEEWGEQAEPHWQKAGYMLKTVYRDDIDSDIVEGMWDAAKKASDERYTKLRFIIVSGDHVFAEKYERLRERYAGDLEFELFVYAWRGGLSGDLRRVAGANHVRYLNAIRYFVSTR